MVVMGGPSPPSRVFFKQTLEDRFYFFLIYFFFFAPKKKFLNLKKKRGVHYQCGIRTTKYLVEVPIIQYHFIGIQDSVQ